MDTTRRGPRATVPAAPGASDPAGDRHPKPEAAGNMPAELGAEGASRGNSRLAHRAAGSRVVPLGREPLRPDFTAEQVNPSVHRILLLRRLATEVRERRPGLDPTVFPREALGEAAALALDLTEWAASALGASTLSDEEFAALSAPARRRYVANRLALRLPLAPEAAIAEILCALESPESDAVTDAPLPASLPDVARLEVLKWVERQIGLGLANRVQDATQQAADAVGYAHGPRTLETWRRRLRSALGAERVEGALADSRRAAAEETAHSGGLPEDDPGSPLNAGYDERMRAREAELLAEIARRYRDAVRPAKARTPVSRR